MMQKEPKVLVVDDELGILESLQVLLRGAGYRVVPALGGTEGVAAIERERPDIIVSDIRMPGVSGLELLARAHELDPETAVILMTAQASLQSAVRAVNDGAFYYLQKPFANDELLAILKRAAESRALRVENHALKQEIRRQGAARTVRPIGRSRCFLDILELAETVAPTDSTILLSGESGTGKEILANYIHALSDRSDRPCLSINCGALPESLLESELFGHVRGSFTGAVKNKVGLLAAAGSGTFFLDEVGDMSPQTQVKMLRAIQEREVIPVGATEAVPVAMRLIAATNRDLEEEIRKGNFRRDLFYRLNVISIKLPPLRDRRDDIPLLVRHFLDRITPDGDPARAVTDEAMELLAEHDWPGNVRELENALERAVVLAPPGPIGPESLPERVREKPKARLAAMESPPNPTMEVIERAYIQWVLGVEGGNKSRAAEVLGVDPSTLYRKIARYGIEGE